MNAEKLTDDELAVIRQRWQAATPGPWIWRAHKRANEFYLNSQCPADRERGLPYHPYVMRLHRWGFSGAQPYFNSTEGMHPATHWTEFDHNGHIVKIDHPDAIVIESAPSDVASLLAHIAALETEIERLRFADACCVEWDMNHPLSQERIAALKAETTAVPS